MSSLSASHILEVAGMGVFHDGSTQGVGVLTKEVSASQEESLWRLLAEHRLAGMFWQGLKNSGAEAQLRPQLRQELALGLREEQLRLARLELAFAHATAALAERGVPIIACKGIVLAKRYYPTRGLRRMHDLDFWLLDSKTEACTLALQAAGFAQRPDKATVHSLNFIDKAGNVLDVHFAMRLFQDRGIDLDTVSVPDTELGCRVFVPEAMVAHLVNHLLGHAASQGALLCWFVDIALVLQRRDVDLSLVRRLLNDEGSWEAFLRMLRSFVELGWVKPRWDIEPQIESARPIMWDGLVRQRRRIAWAGWAGKLRLAKSVMLRRAQHPPYPGLRDWMWQPVDWLYESSGVFVGTGSLLKRREHD
ncbi:MAG TPA: nucleotidyltransferase family protein [Polyangiaceae bacterium]|nr:nucleotidyltransferase family protein [Polyangiaceae bacterium]